MKASPGLKPLPPDEPPPEAETRATEVPLDPPLFAFEPLLLLLLLLLLPPLPLAFFAIVICSS
jgi:hypothetical protein